MTKVLFAGETWTIQTTHIKGVDSFTQYGYGEGVQWVRDALTAAHIEVTHIPNHLAMREFPSSIEPLNMYDCIILSDIGSNTLLLHPDTTTYSMSTPNRLNAIRDYVKQGGGLVMIGGYMSFQGIDGRARYAKTAIEQALPVTMYDHDDRVEIPQGFKPIVSSGQHVIMQGLPNEWPPMLFYNRIVAKPGADVLLEYNQDPILVAWSYGKGRTVAFSPDAAPHGATKQFLEWEYFNVMWQRIVNWVSRKID